MSSPLEVKGKYTNAKIFTHKVEEGAVKQVQEICNLPFTKGSKIRIMPDVHQGKGCVIGTTMVITDKVVPSLVGVDIGCGLSYVEINIDKDDVNYEKLDEVIRTCVPSGKSIREEEHYLVNMFNNFKDIRMPLRDVDRINKSLGTLGGGNHFIELNYKEPGRVLLVVHSGSRNLGAQIATKYQDAAYKELSQRKEERQEIIEQYKKQGREKELSSVLSNLKPNKIPKSLAYTQGKLMKDYLNDMGITQLYAEKNRQAMLLEICKGMGWISKTESGTLKTTVHNYIDLDHKILRKGAISARLGEEVIIPINMKEGSILGVGRGNADWNFSGPHGAGRVMSRSKAREEVSIDEFKNSMKGVWTNSVNESTIDEAPMAYKKLKDITDNIEDTVEVKQIVKPLYNFKASN